MRFNQWMTGLAVSLSCFNGVNAAELPVYEQIQVPQCLAAKLSMPYSVLAENSQFKIIELAEQELSRVVLLADETQCGRFINVSDKLNTLSTVTKRDSARALLHKKPLQVLSGRSYVIRHEPTVRAALEKIAPNNIWATLTYLSAYQNRSATKETGVATAHWLKKEFDDLAAHYGRTDTQSYFVSTGRYKQPSLVTVIGKDIAAPAVVLGAHMDTLDGIMPGAGDDASGSSSVMEAARVLMASQSTLDHPVYIIWYAAEERGLIGSQHVVAHFLKHSIPVKAVVQFDMTGYRVDAQDPTMWVYRDYTDTALSDFIANLIETYIHVPVDYSSCGYGCSDHASWTEEGIPAAFPCESNFEEHNPYIHSASDTVDLLNLEHMTNFTKLAIAFALELAID